MEDNKEVKDKTVEEMNENISDAENVNDEDNTDKEQTVEVNTEDGTENNEVDMLKKSKEEIKKLQEELDSMKDKFLRVTAEYDNYRKRSIKEKEGIYSDAYVDVLKEIIPVLDNLERAVVADGSVEDLKKGIEMTLKGCKDSFAKLGVEEIDATGEFDPNLHNAVMHIEDENLGKNAVAEVFQKGYKKEDKIIRHTMVKVAN